ncbi:Rpp20 subunit of nuclear RNase MRP and P-domain-containing protein [Terfezia claveryi]|nr:Rpp20 subunit of nuclear RNase MRP and P-domain-containing protein [Terfezia claveryi]
MSAEAGSAVEVPTFSSAPPPKLPPLPPTHTLQKRPLLHPPIPPVHSKRAPQTVYISARTPFISAVKRVRKILSVQEASLWSTTSTLDDASNEQHRRQRNYRNNQRRRGGGGQRGDFRNVAPSQPIERGELVGEGVVLKATGKAINKCLSLGVYFMKDDRVSVRVGTGSVDAVDDVVRKPGATAKQPQSKKATTTTTTTQEEITTQPENPTTETSPSLDLPLPNPRPTTNTKKRKSAELEAEETSEHETQGGKKARTEEHTPTVLPFIEEGFSDSNPPTIPPNLPLPSSSDVPMVDTRDPQGEGDGEDDEDESEDDDDDDGDDEDYMRIRKLSMIEIKITLVRP